MMTMTRGGEGPVTPGGYQNKTKSYSDETPSACGGGRPAARERLGRWRANGQRLVMAGPQDDDLAGGVLKDPRDVLGAEPRVVVGRGRDDDPVKSLVVDRLTQGMAVGSPPFDARVDGDPELRGPPLDRLLERDGDARLARQRRVER